MLVKIGNAWIDPAQIVALDTSIGIARARTLKGLNVELGSGNNLDEYAATLNNALQTQSYGNDDGVEKL